MYATIFMPRLTQHFAARCFTRACHLALAALLLQQMSCCAWAQPSKGSSVPYASIKADGEGYAGPGRESSNDLFGATLRIGILIPMHGPEKADGNAILLAAQMALHDASRYPMPQGRRLALAIGDESGPSWDQVSDKVMHLILNQNVVALITSTNGTSTHISEQVGNRIGVPVLTLSSDPTTTQIDIPWIFRMGPSDVQEAQALEKTMYRIRNLQRVLLITEQNNYDGNSAKVAVRQVAHSMNVPSPDELIFNPSQPEFSAINAYLQTHTPQAVMVWTRAESVAIVLRALRAKNLSVPIYLSQQASQAEFGTDCRILQPALATRCTALDISTVAADGKSSTKQKNFAQRYLHATGKPPSPTAAAAYDAVRLTVRALRDAGPNRARLRDQLATVKDFSGVSGIISFDREGNDVTRIHLVRLMDQKNLQLGKLTAPGATQP